MPITSISIEPNGNWTTPNSNPAAHHSEEIIVCETKKTVSECIEIEDDDEEQCSHEVPIRSIEIIDDDEEEPEYCGDEEETLSENRTPRNTVKVIVLSDEEEESL